MAKKIIAILLQVPLVLFVVASFGASIYAAINHIANVTYSTTIFIGSLLLMYCIGVVLLRKNTTAEQHP